MERNRIPFQRTGNGCIRVRNNQEIVDARTHLGDDALRDVLMDVLKEAAQRTVDEALKFRPSKSRSLRGKNFANGQNQQF